MSTEAPTFDIVSMHAERVAEHEHILNVLIPQEKDMIEKFRAVLRDETKLTDAMANAVFKKYSIIRNANLKKKSIKKRDRGDEKGAEEHAVSDEAYEKIQAEALEHKHYLRRLKGKSASKLSADEKYHIEQYIIEREQWIKMHENGGEFSRYIFKAQRIIDEYEKEQRRIQKYLEDANVESQRRAITETQQRQRISAGESGALVSLSDSGKQLVQLPQKRNFSTRLDSLLLQTDVFSRSKELQSEYLCLIGVEDTTGLLQQQLKTDDSYCPQCEVERIVDFAQAIMTCPQCGICVRFNDNSLRNVPFSDEIHITQKNKGKYEKRTYYEKWKKMVSGQLNSEIAEKDWQTIYLECVNRRYKFITRPMLRKLLRSLGMNRYYELIPAITNELNDVPLIHFSPEEERTLDAMFEEALELFERCPAEIKRRSNFISYSYFFHQACTMAGYTAYCESFPLLTGIENKKRHDCIWKWMCENKQGEPVWTFYPTV